MKAEIYKQLLEKYSCKDELREKFKNPFVYDGKCIATNTVSLITTPFVEGIKENEDAYKSVARILHKSEKPILTINVSEFLEKIKQIPLEDGFDIVKEEVKCDACNGYGSVDYEFCYDGETFTEELDCPVCDGTRLVTKNVENPNGKKILKRTEVIEISNRWFCAARISEILELIDIFQPTEIIVREVSDGVNTLNIPLEFDFGDVQLLQMPYLQSDSQKPIFSI